MGFKGKLLATSMVVGAAAGIYVSKQLNRNNPQANANSNTAQPNTAQTNTTQPNTAQANTTQGATQANPINYQYDSAVTAKKAATPTNVYLEADSNPNAVQ